MGIPTSLQRTLSVPSALRWANVLGLCKCARRLWNSLGPYCFLADWVHTCHWCDPDVIQAENFLQFWQGSHSQDPHTSGQALDSEFIRYIETLWDKSDKHLEFTTSRFKVYIALGKKVACRDVNLAAFLPGLLGVTVSGEFHSLAIQADAFCVEIVIPSDSLIMKLIIAFDWILISSTSLWILRSSKPGWW